MKIHLLFFILFLWVSGAASAQTSTENYVLIRTYKNKGMAEVNGSAYTGVPSTVQTNITYLDGLGKTKLEVAAYASPMQKDILVQTGFDALHRPEKSYLPIVAGEGNGTFRTGINFDYYNNSSNVCTPTGNAYLKTLYEDTAEYKVDKLNLSDGSFNYNYQGWTTFYPSSLGVFNFTVTLGTGWYSIYIRLKEDSSGDPVNSYALKVGVGDVYIAAGQSNIAGQDSPPTVFKSTPTSPYDCVTAINERRDCDTKYIPVPSYFSPIYYTNSISSNGKNGWFYTDLGNKLVDLQGTPVAFFNAGFDGTSVSVWNSSISGGASHANPLCNGYQPYQMLKKGLTLFASTFGIRTILWQQGEADNVANTSQSGYATTLSSVISQTRSDFNSNLNWMIARTSFDGSTNDANVTNGQDDVITSDDGGVNTNKQGPNTDSFGSGYRNTVDGLHFSYNTSTMIDGFEPLAEAWKTAINGQNPGRISANAVPSITMTKSGSNYTLSAPNGYDEYRWVYPGDPLDDYFSTSQTLYLTSSTTTGHRCFVRQGTNWIASGTVHPFVENCYTGSRKGFEEKFEEELGVNFKVSPNPTENEVAIEFYIDKLTQVRLDIVDAEGRAVKHILQTELTANKHKYSENLQSLPQGTYMCRLILNELVLTKKILKK